MAVWMTKEIAQEIVDSQTTDLHTVPIIGKAQLIGQDIFIIVEIQ
jgi:hypothetical protein